MKHTDIPENQIRTLLPELGSSPGPASCTRSGPWERAPSRRWPGRSGRPALPCQRWTRAAGPTDSSCSLRVRVIRNNSLLIVCAWCLIAAEEPSFPFMTHTHLKPQEAWEFSSQLWHTPFHPHRPLSGPKLITPLVWFPFEPSTWSPAAWVPSVARLVRKDESHHVILRFKIRQRLYIVIKDKPQTLVPLSFFMNWPRHSRTTAVLSLLLCTRRSSDLEEQPPSLLCRHSRLRA